jgi:hypothetical protein
VRSRIIAVRIARRGIESSAALGRHRWVIERTMAWLFGCHRLGIRYADPTRSRIVLAYSSGGESPNVRT